MTDEDNAVVNGEVESDEESEDEEEDEDEEDPEDLQETLREKCGELSKCVALKNEFDACESRVSSRQQTEENCAQELLDFVGCVDKCVSDFLLLLIDFIVNNFSQQPNDTEIFLKKHEMVVLTPGNEFVNYLFISLFVIFLSFTS